MTTANSTRRIEKSFKFFFKAIGSFTLRYDMQLVRSLLNEITPYLQPETASKATMR